MKDSSYGLATIVAMILSSTLGLAQQACSTGVSIDGVITDPSGSLIAGARVQAADGQTTVTNAAGRFVLPCVPVKDATVTVRAEGFATGTVEAHNQAGQNAHLTLQLAIAQVQTDVQVSGNDTVAMDANHGGDTNTLTTREVQQLADDPDDFLRELQVLASVSGGRSHRTMIRRRWFSKWQRASA